MSNFLKTSIALLLASCMSMSAAYAKQVTVTIGDGTSTSNSVPYGNRDKNSTTQIIYTQAELGTVAGPITSIAFDVAAEAIHTTTSLKIYIGISSSTTFASNTDYCDVNTMTLVYDGTPTLGKALGWEEIELQTPYLYDGKSNLVIVIGRQANSYSTNLKYTTTSCTNQCHVRGLDTKPEAGDPIDTSISYSRLSVRPNIRLLIGEEDLVTAGGIIYRIKEGEAIVKSCLSTQSGAVTVQSKVTSEGTTYDVKRIADGAFANCSKLTSITIPSSVTSIGVRAFQNCSSLTAVNLPTSITEIGYKLFAGCSGLSSINIPNTITTIGVGAFDGCSALTNITIPASVSEIKDDAFKGCTAVSNISFSDCETPITLGTTSVEGISSYYYPGIFEDCPVESVYLGRDVTYTNPYYSSPFKSKTTLTRISFGSKITTLKEYLFNECTNVTELTIPANIVTVKESALYRLSGLKELNIEDSDTALDLPTYANTRGMFSSSGIEKLYLGRNVNFCTTQTIAGAFYSCRKLSEVTIGKKVTELGDNMFYYCTNLKTVYNKSSYFTVTAGDAGNGYVAYYADLAMNGENFGQTGDFLYYENKDIKTIYKYVGTKTDVIVPAGYLLDSGLFIGCEDITSITFSQGLKRIPRACMERCTSLTTVNIPNSVEEIDEYALFGCSSLTSIVLPSGLKRLGAHSLQMCSALTNVNIPSGITTLEDFCLSRTALTSFDVPANVKRIEAGVFHWCRSLTEVSLPDELEYIGPFAFKSCSDLKEIEIPAKVDSIALHCFYGCSKMTDVKLHEGLTSIGDFAFFLSGVKQINLPNTLQRIGVYGLCGNDFEELILPESLTQLEIGALSRNSNLKSINIPSGIKKLSPYALYLCSNLNDITLPETMTEIGQFALNSVPMKHIHWPTSIKSIGYQALGGNYKYGAHIIPASVTDIDCMLFYELEDGNNYYCYSPMMLPENVFMGQTLLGSILYVLPELVEQYRNSVLGNRFKAILPLGDTNSDGMLSIADLPEEVRFMKETNASDLKLQALGNYDTNGDGWLSSDDLSALHQLMLTPEPTGAALELNSIAHVVPNENPTEASDGCILLPTSGCLENQGPEALDLLNQIRMEACMEGVWWSGYTHLSMEDFHPYIWSTDLERIARTRVLESSYTRYHDRLNGKSCFSPQSNGVSSNSECIAFYSSFLGQMTSYYGEKGYWMEKTPGQVTGHYTSMITPANKYVGMAGFAGTATMQNTSNDKAGQETDFLPPTGYQTFNMDVKSDYIDRYEWFGYYNYSTIKENYTLKDGEYMLMRYAPIMLFKNGVGQDRGFYMTDPNMTYTSSNPDVAVYDTEKGILIGLKEGATTLTAKSGNITSQTIVTITCNHDMQDSDIDENLKVHSVCSKCGYEEDYSVPNYFHICFWTGNSGSGRPNSSYNVGDQIKVSGSYSNGSEKFNKIIVDCDRPDLLEAPRHLEGFQNWNVLGAGDVTITAFLQYNPSYKCTYKLHLVEPEQ